MIKTNEEYAREVNEAKKEFENCTNKELLEHLDSFTIAMTLTTDKGAEDADKYVVTVVTLRELILERMN